MTVAQRTQALLELVDSDRARKTAAIAEEADQRVTTILADAHAEARRRMREAFAEERARRTAQLAAAQARLATRRRVHEQRRATALLAAGRPRLEQALLERWSRPEARSGWVAGVIAQARAALPAGAWRIVHAAGWPDGDRDALIASLAGALDAPPQAILDAALGAGLKVVAGCNTIDGTLAGLLADRAEVDARLLQSLETAAE